MAKIIISYRRSDSDAFAGRVHDRIASRYGNQSAFIDVDNIPLGKDFRIHIQQELANADAVLVIIGPKWLGSARGGRTRIMDVTDPVRIEVETALAKGVPTIPILVGNTIMPRPEQLPETLKDFPFLNAAPVDTSRDFHRDLDRIIAAIDRILGLPTDLIGNLERASDDRHAAEAGVQIRAEEVRQSEPDRVARAADEEPRPKPEAQVPQRAAERPAIDEPRRNAEAIDKAEIAESERAAAARADEEHWQKAEAQARQREAERQAVDEQPLKAEAIKEAGIGESEPGAAAAAQVDEEDRHPTVATATPASGPAPRAKASLFEIKSWSYLAIATVAAALACVAGLANQAGLFTASVSSVPLLSANVAVFAAALAFMMTKLTANSGVGRAATAFVGLYVLSVVTSLLSGAVIRAVPDATMRSVVVVFNITVIRLIFWIFAAAVFLPFGTAMRDGKMLAAVAGAGAIQGIWLVILVAMMASTGSRVPITYLYPIVSFGITLPLFAYGVRRQAIKI